MAAAEGAAAEAAEQMAYRDEYSFFKAFLSFPRHLPPSCLLDFSYQPTILAHAFAGGCVPSSRLHIHFSATIHTHFAVTIGLKRTVCSHPVVLYPHLPRLFHFLTPLIIVTKQAS